MEVEPNLAMNYIFTAHKPTAVTASVVGNFTSPSDLNLIVAKSNRLEVFKCKPTGLEAVLDVPLNGRISTLQLLRPQGKPQDLLFILLERYQVAVLEYNLQTGSLDTWASGDVADAVGRPCDNGQLATVDPERRCIALQLYDAMIKVIPLGEGQQGAAAGGAAGGSSFGSGSTGQSGKDIRAFNARLDEMETIDMAMLAGFSKPTFALLYQDTSGARHVRGYEVLLNEEDVAPVPRLSIQNLDPGACLLIPVPAGGLVVLGQQTLEYVGPEGEPRLTVPTRPTVFKAWGRVDADGSRTLLSDHLGLLYVLVLVKAPGSPKVTSLKLEIVGRTSAASSLTYIDAGVVFVGSRQGDSQLVKLHATPPDPAAPNSFVQVLDTWPNLGPIVDFTVLDLDRQAGGQLVACSGAMSDGSLRIVRNGVGINEQASIELPGIKGLWSLRPSWCAPHHKYLVLGFVNETRILAMNQEDELDEAELPGFNGNALTHWCGNMASDHIVQVTAVSVRVLAADSGALVWEWAAEGAALSVAAGNATQVAVASGAGQLVVLEVSAVGLAPAASLALGEEVACIDVTPTGADDLRSSLVVVGTWHMDVRLLALVPGAGPGGQAALQELHRQPVEGGFIPRSVMMWRFEGVPHLLVGQGDGHLQYWRMTDAASGTLVDKKKLVLGTKQVMLRPFMGSVCSAGDSAGFGVFASSDRPAVLYSTNHKVMYAQLNDGDVNHVAPFNSPSFPDSLAIAKEELLTIGTVDKIQKLHTRTVALHEQPRRIAYQAETATFGVVTVANLGMSDEQGHVRVYDAHASMELRATFTLLEGEIGCAITSCQLGDAAEKSDDAPTYFVVGTAVALPDEPEPTRGRLLVLEYKAAKLELVASADVKGAAYDVLPFQGGQLLSSCNNKVQIHKYVSRVDGQPELTLECSAAGHTMSLYLDTRGDHILVGDLMRSLTLFMYRQTPQPTLRIRAQDYATNWCTAVAMLDDDTYLAAENSYNLLLARKSDDGADDDDRGRLQVVGEYHVGEFVNRVRPGSLVTRLPDSDLANVPTWLIGTIDGSVLVLASLPPPLYELVERLQDALRKVVPAVGGLSHQRWRSFSNERREVRARGFVDGDLVESFLELGPKDAAKVVALLGGGLTVDEVSAKVEELSRLR